MGAFGSAVSVFGGAAAKAVTLANDSDSPSAATRARAGRENEAAKSTGGKRGGLAAEKHGHLNKQRAAIQAGGSVIAAAGTENAENSFSGRGSARKRCAWFVVPASAGPNSA